MSAVCPRCGSSNPHGRLAFCPVCALTGAEDGGFPEVPGLALEAELGRGGMGHVFRARHAALGRAVAVKVLSPENADDPDFRVRFEREARMLAELDHPNIVRVHDFGTTPDGDVFLVLELVTGGTLRSILPVPVERGVGILLELCAALEHAHAHGVLHRDIKPENVLVAPGGSVKITDFGIARFFGAEHGTLRQSSRIFGTPGYLAPEAVALAPPGPRLDVFALGVLLHELLSGVLPGKGDALVPVEIASVIRRATAFNPDERLPNPAALAAELRRAVARLDRAPSDDELSDEERTWLGAVAILISVAAAVAIYALAVSFTPRSLPAEEALPLVAFGVEKLPDGRVLTQARFEIWPVLGAAAAFAVALAAYGLLRRHWREAGLDRPAPERALAGASSVLKLGIGLVALAFVRGLLERLGQVGIVSYIPVLGGVLELYMLYLFFGVVLEALRTRRPLRKEPRLWLGLTLALLPPVYHFLSQLASAERG
jgi:serine/threonine-protein kinase